ncbi:MAG: hypothetical protein J7K64_05920 [Bacteroidales bacterium]|nr:hypothetical protein [Bacteroidales bacterium]
MKKYSEIKHIFKKGIIYLLPLYVLWILYIEFMPMYYNRPTNTRWYFLKETLAGKYKIPKANKIFLGESRLNAGLDFTKIPDAYSFASGGSTPVEMYYILKKYLKNHPKPDTVFLSISPRFFCETFAFWHFAVRNNVISHADLQEILSETEKNDTVLGSFPKLNYCLYKADYLGYYQDDVLYNYVFTGYSENKKMISEMQSMQGGRPHPGLKDSCSLPNYETKYTDFRPSSLLLKYFEKTADLCRKNNIKFFFFSMPMNESSFNVLKPDFVSKYQKTIQICAGKYPEFDISDSLYAYPDNYFGDASHLNPKGRKIFTNDFISAYLKPKP